jgi:O-antigen/teichoic acid export membrane protein
MDHERQLKRGMVWLGSASLVAKLVDTLSLIVVLSFLSREQLGLATLASSVVAFLESLNGLGIGTAVIQRRDLSASETAGAHWYSIFVGLGLTAFAFLIAPVFAAIYSAPELTLMTRVAAAKLLFVSMATVPLGLLSRDLQFRNVGVISTVATVLSSGLTIVLAAAGAGAWAPLVANTAHGLFQLLGVCVLAPLFPRPTLAFARIRPLISAGVHVAGGSVFGQVTRNLDYFVVGRFAGLGTLGTYRIAFDLAMGPMVAILNVIGRSALPVYSRLAAQLPELTRAFGWTVRSLCLLILAPLLLVFLEGERIFELLAKTPEPYTLTVLRLLCLAAFLRAVSQPFSQVLVALGHTRRNLLEAFSSTLLLSVSMALSIVVVTGYPVAVRVGIGWLVAYVLQVGVDLLLTRGLLPGIARALGRALLAPLSVALLVALATLLVRPLLPFGDAPWHVVTHGALVVGFYVLGLRTLAGVRLRGLVGAGSSKEPSL